MTKKKPLYLQIVGDLKERIKAEDFSYDEPFVTEERLTKEYNVSRITTQRALDVLESAGLIYRKCGSGTFVTRDALKILNGVRVAQTGQTERQHAGGALVALVMPFEVREGVLFQCVEGMNSVLNRSGCIGGIYNSNRSAETEAEVLLSLLKRGIDGVICCPVNGRRNFEIYNQFYIKKIPFVLIDHYIEDMPISYIVSDNFNGAKMLCEYAIKKGHSRIGFLSQRSVNSSVAIRDRYRGYTAGLVENGIDVNLDYVCVDLDDKYGMLDQEEAAQYGSRDAFVAALVKGLYEKGVTCILCQNDAVAMGVYERCAEMGISVPDEMWVMGFDNLDLLNEHESGNKLVTIEQNFYEMGVRAGETLLKELCGEETAAKEVVPVKLVDRIK